MVRLFACIRWSVKPTMPTDGDQMAIHVPLSEEAQAEARILMLAAEHILNRKTENRFVTPSQDMVLGNYYLTTGRSRSSEKVKSMVFKDVTRSVMLLPMAMSALLIAWYRDR